MTNASSEFSFGLYPELDQELTDIYRRNIEHGVANGDIVGDDALAAAVHNAVATSATELAPSTASWARAELDTDFEGGACWAWKLYETLPGIHVPSNLEELLDQGTPELAQTVERLHQAREALIASGETTPDGFNVGETMKLKLVPWQAMRDHIGDFDTWVKTLRDTQGVATSDDYFDSTLLEHIKENKLLYRDPNTPMAATTTALPAISVQAYLDRKIEQDGPWGIMLVQTSEEAGLDRLVQGSEEERSPNALTNSGAGSFEVAGQQADGLGIFEWIALTMQVDPKTLSPTDVSWLLANRFDDTSGEARVPLGYWEDGRVYSDLDWADDQDDNIRPRLAVM